jgi:O-antigen/teichoic acid export membrane protein
MNIDKCKSKINIYLKKLGLSSGFVWIVINRLFSLIKGPISAFVQILCLSPHDQGLWYTFGSLGALTTFAELGFTQIVTQFISHEYAHLSYDNGKIRGSLQSLDKFFSLIRYAILFYLIIIPTAVILLIIMGFYFFSTEKYYVFTAWCIYSFSGGMSLGVSLFQAIYLGLDKVSEIQKNILINNIVISLLMWTLLFLKIGIFSLAISAIIGGIFTIIMLYLISPEFWKQIVLFTVVNKYNWLKEIIPLQWKYALGFIASYFIYQIFVPAVYRIDGNILAGKLGITLVLVGLVRAISDAFLGANLPRLNIMIAQGKEAEMYHFFLRLFLAAICVNVFGALSIIFFTIMIHNFSIGDRFLDIPLTIILVAINIPINIIGILGNYTLLHKDGSLYPLSIIAGSIGAISMFLIYPQFNLTIAFLFLLVSFWLVLLPLNAFAFSIKKRKYLHGE